MPRLTQKGEKGWYSLIITDIISNGKIEVNKEIWNSPWADWFLF